MGEFAVWNRFSFAVTVRPPRACKFLAVRGRVRSVSKPGAHLLLGRPRSVQQRFEEAAHRRREASLRWLHRGETLRSNTNSRPTGERHHPATIRTFRVVGWDQKCFSDHPKCVKTRKPRPDLPRALSPPARCGDACDAWARPPRTQPQHDCSAAQTARRCGGAHASAGCPTRTTRIRTPRTTPGAGRPAAHPVS